MRTGHLQFCAQWLLTLPKNALQQCSIETKTKRVSRLLLQKVIAGQETKISEALVDLDRVDT
jgi:hypothetical protein